MSRADARRLLAYGSWVSLSALLSPLLEALDRIVIAALVGARAVAYYSVSFTLVEKTRIIPAALSRSLFPKFSGDSGDTATRLTKRAITVVGVGMALVVAPGILLVEPFINLWLGADFGARAGPVAQLLLLGMWANGVAFVPFVLLQARGRPDIVAKFHLLEFVPFVALLWFLTDRFGIGGAAVAWALRCAVDTVLLLKVTDALRTTVLTLAFEWVALLLAFGIARLVHPRNDVCLAAAAVIGLLILCRLFKIERKLARQLYQKSFRAIRHSRARRLSARQPGPSLLPVHEHHQLQSLRQYDEQPDGHCQRADVRLAGRVSLFRMRGVRLPAD